MSSNQTPGFSFIITLVTMINYVSMFNLDMVVKINIVSVLILTLTDHKRNVGFLICPFGKIRFVLSSILT